METRIVKGHVTVTVKHKGAELSGLYHDGHQIEYIWQADSAFWPKSSPVLFPVVGQLKNDTYKLGDRAFNLPRHGFARELDFELENSTESSAVFFLKSNDETKTVYPFDFELRIHYGLSEDGRLNVMYEVQNAGRESMLFSLGAHPAFKVPLLNGESYTDYFLEFQQTENAERWKISPEGLVENQHQPFLRNVNRLDLRKDLFYEDALVFKDLRSNAITIRSGNHSHGVQFSYEGFPYFGIWAFRDADFVCLEPWCGIADNVDHDQQLKTKEGIQRLEAGEQWTRAWSVRCF